MPNAKLRAERPWRDVTRRESWQPFLNDAVTRLSIAPGLDHFDDGLHEPSSLHAQRLDTIEEALRTAGVRSVADLGCGDGALVRRLLRNQRIERIVAMDADSGRLARLERSVVAGEIRSGRLSLVHGSFAAAQKMLGPVEGVAMVETIEHLEPGQLSALEHQVFSVMQPALVLITTPNVEYNGLLGMAPGQRREAGHRFEWPRARFRGWAAGVALRQGYAVRIAGIGPEDPRAGCPTQWAKFERLSRPP